MYIQYLKSRIERAGSGHKMFGCMLVLNLTNNCVMIVPRYTLTGVRI
jgi:hypothetical protein